MTENILNERTFETPDDLCDFAVQCGESNDAHQLILLSIACGHVESYLIETEKLGVGGPRDAFPIGPDVFDLYRQFVSLVDESDVCTAVKRALEGGDTRTAIRAVADFVWSRLSNRFFKDKLHVQSVYSFLVTKQLDCFGLALTIYLYCRLLGVDAELTLSEDHSWLSFPGDGEDEVETAELTWSGKDAPRRATSIQDGNTPAETMWLYQKGGRYAVRCDHRTAVAAVVSSLNDECNLQGAAFSEPLLNLKCRLLQAVHKAGFLAKYPMGLYGLADCLKGLADAEEEDNEDDDVEVEDATSMECVAYYTAAVALATEKYHDHHVYVHTAFGNYYAKSAEDFPAAVACYANASRSVSHYVFTKTDAHVLKVLSDAVKKLAELAKSSDPEELTGECCLEVVRLIAGLAAWAVATQVPVVGEDVQRILGGILCAFPAEARKYAAEVCANEEFSSSDNATAEGNTRRLLRGWLRDPGGKRTRLQLLLSQVFRPPIEMGEDRAASKRKRRRGSASSLSSSDQPPRTNSKRRTRQGATSRTAKTAQESVQSQSPKRNSREQDLFCLCQTPYDNEREYIGCDSCDGWFHFECVNLPPAKARSMDTYVCPNCAK